MYSVQDLSDLTGVSIRTIQYYVQRGVISRPLPKAGRFGIDKYKLYTREHLQQLREVQAILDNNMTL